MLKLDDTTKSTLFFHVRVTHWTAVKSIYFPSKWQLETIIFGGVRGTSRDICKQFPEPVPNHRPPSLPYWLMIMQSGQNINPWGLPGGISWPVLHFPLQQRTFPNHSAMRLVIFTLAFFVFGTAFVTPINATHHDSLRPRNNAGTTVRSWL